MQGMQESGIHTYYVPSSTDLINEISYVVADEYSWRQLIDAINAGDYPEHQEDPYAGIVPDSYMPNAAGETTDQLAGAANPVVPSDYVVDVRNGCGIQGSATSVSDMLSLAGFQRGEIGNADSFVYETTLVIYRNESSKAVAEDIRQRLGYGKAIVTSPAYVFAGDILVMIGNDFSTNR
jgi:hypothetical protein